MQNAELFRRGIVLPVDRDAQERLRRNHADETAAAHHLAIGDRLFEKLWELEFFESINAHTGSLLDDYEEDFIGIEHFDRLCAIAADTRREAASDAEVAGFLEEFESLVEKAKKHALPLLIVL